uniref:Uncharacterized protein n=1 Tax=Anguilla anguilla TaxID=7936 RepID=A0A0E9RT74_ANGAN
MTHVGMLFWVCYSVEVHTELFSGVTLVFYGCR